jgi:DNA-binding NarL/FixJ family response regulator
VHTILIVDDDPRFRAQARELLMNDGFEVVGEAEDGATAIELARVRRPEFVLVDVGLPDLDGFEVARRLAAEVSPPRVVLTSSRDARAYGRRLQTAPVLGFMPKEQVSGAAIRDLVRRG